MESFNTLDEWVEYIQTLHYREIDLTLDRVQVVLQRLYPEGVSFKLISLAGTNGKGSTAAMLSSIYQAAGYAVGKYTSPHLVRFNERIQLNGRDIDDPRLLDSFDRVETARGDTRLTFFEYGTLLAIDLFVEAKIDIAIMEVGLGGRLDAVNMLDADVAIVTSLSIDHTSWLGDTLEQIGREKIGIARTQRPCVVGLRTPPDSVLKFCTDQRVELHQIERDFSAQEQGSVWSFHSDDLFLEDLPLPFGQAGVQLDNAAVAVHATQQLNDLVISQEHIEAGLENASLSARCQVISNSPLIILDVAHNVDSVQRLSRFLEDQDYQGNLIALCGMLKDKEIAKSINSLLPMVDSWHFATIHNERGSTAEQLGVHLLSAGEQHTSGPPSPHYHDNVVDAYRSLRAELQKHDCLVVFGSFHIVGDIIDSI